MSDSSVVLLQTAIGDYRQLFLEKASALLGDRFYVLTGRSYFPPAYQTSISLPGKLLFIKNTFLLRGKLLWQDGQWGDCLRAGTVVAEGNPRILSTWVLLLVRRLLRRKTLLWMHAWPQAGRASRTETLRHWMRQLSSGIIVYTHSQKNELAEKMPHWPIHVAPNSLYQQSQMKFSPGERSDFIYVGRLIPQKKPLLLVKAFLKAGLPSSCRLILAGDGPELAKIKDLVHTAGLKNRVILPGHVSDFSAVETLYAGAIASISPGYVGLSLTQSFAFGVPMLISRNEPHSPEIEAAEEGMNCRYFNEDDEDSLAEMLQHFFQNRSTWQMKGPSIVERCRETYTVEKMCDGFLAAVTSAGRTS